MIKEEGYKKLPIGIIKYGMSFYGKMCMIKGNEIC